MMQAFGKMTVLADDGNKYSIIHDPSTEDLGQESFGPVSKCNFH